MTETIQDILAEMDSAVAEVETANAEALKQAESMSVTYQATPDGMGVDKDSGVVDERRLALNLEAARLANEERNKPLADRLADLRERGRELLEAERDAVEAALYKAQQAEGPQGEAWAVAESRRAFVQEDVANADPGELPAMYRLAQLAGDSTGAWLWKRYAEPRLVELQEAEVERDELMGTAGTALVELRRQFPTSPAQVAHHKEVARLARLEVELGQPRGEVELAPVMKEFAATMKVDAKYLDPELVAQAVSVR